MGRFRVIWGDLPDLGDLGMNPVTITKNRIKIGGDFGPHSIIWWHQLVDHELVHHETIDAFKFLDPSADMHWLISPPTG